MASTESEANQLAAGGAMDGVLGRRLRSARKSSGMAFAQFAKSAGYSEGHLRSVENGRRQVTADVAAAYDRVLKTGGEFGNRLSGRANGIFEPVWGPGEAVAGMRALLAYTDGDDVNRRDLVVRSGGALAALAANWVSALDKSDPPIAKGSRQVTSDVVDYIARRLDHLRHLDDQVGGRDLASLARKQLTLVSSLLQGGRYSEPVGRRLHSLAAEASRQVAWGSFDQDQHGVAQHYFELALRTSAVAGDPITGAYAMSFLAVQCYSTGRADDAVTLLTTAQREVSSQATALMMAMLAAREARAHSKLRDAESCARRLDAARAALDKGPSPDDPPTLYWVTPGEIEMIAGSSALELGEPAEALRRFDAAIKADYQGVEFPRSHAIYLARAAEAHIAQRDLDAAVARATNAMHCLGGVDSARSSSTLADLRGKLATFRRTPVVRDFLDQLQ